MTDTRGAERDQTFPEYDRYQGEPPLTPEVLRLGPIAYGSQPWVGESGSVRMLRLEQAIELATSRIYGGLITEVDPGSLVVDTRDRAWWGYVSVFSVCDHPTATPGITVTLAREMLVGNRNLPTGANPAEATRSSITWYDHKSGQGLAMSVTTNGHGFFHARPNFTSFQFVPGDTNFVTENSSIDASDKQIGESFAVAEQTLRNILAHGVEITDPDEQGVSERRRYIVEVGSDSTLPTGYYYATKMSGEYPYRKTLQERWRDPPRESAL